LGTDRPASSAKIIGSSDHETPRDQLCRHCLHKLQAAIITNLKRFLLELGRDFAFVGEQYLLQVGGQDFRLDLLFYHRELRALIAIELKVDEFKPRYANHTRAHLLAYCFAHRKTAK
jgi:hypothetical protein